MKKKFLIFLLIYNFAEVYSKGNANAVVDDTAYAKCIYRVVFQPDSTDLDNIRSEKTLLLIGRNFSIFQSINKIKMDSVANNIRFSKTSTIDASAFPRSSFWERIYKNIPQANITTIDRIEIKEYAYTQDMKIFNWKYLPTRKLYSVITVLKQPLPMLDACGRLGILRSCR